MTVLFVYGFCGLGGVETALLNRSEALKHCGIESFILFGQPYGDGGEEFAALPHVRVGLQHLVEFASRQIDVVCVVDYPDVLAIVQREFSGAAMVLESHASITTRLVEFHRLASDSSCAAFVVPSRYNRDLVLRGSDGKGTIHVMPNCLSTDRFQPQPLDALRRRFGELTRKQVVVWVGRLEDEKNPQDFVRLAQEVVATRRDSHFLCIGDAPHDAQYRYRLSDQVPPAMRHKFSFVPAVRYDDMPLVYSLAGATGGCLVSTSRFESVPMTFLEAMACGCPVVAANVGGVTEIVEHGLTGELFELDDPDGVLGSIGRLMSGGPSGYREAVTTRARVDVCERHSLDVVGPAYAALLRAVTEVRCSGASPIPR